MDVMDAAMNIRKKIESRIPQGWGTWISCYEGWDWILEDIEEMLNYLDPEYEVHQVKEKFGTLRFYYAIHGDKIVHKIASSLVRQAEYESEYTCEICGCSSRIATDRVAYDPTVKLRTSGAYMTRCDTCFEIKDR